MVKTKITASEIVEKVGKELYGEKFNLDDPKLKNIYKKVYEIFIKGLDEKNKGVLIIGGIGVGKTALMKVYQKIFLGSARGFKMTYAYELKDMSEELTVSQIKNYYGYELKSDLYIDDIGFGNDVKRYGNTVNIISEIITERYDLFISSGFKTHLSSNIVAALKDKTVNIPTIEKLYGARVLDRIKEMCEVITLNGESLRK